MRSQLVFIFLGIFAATANGKVFYRKLVQSQDEDFSCIILEENTVRKYKGFRTDDENELRIKSRPTVQAPADTMLRITETSQILEIWGRNEKAVDAHISALCKSIKNLQPLSAPAQDPEIQKIIDGGDQSNRIDVVFMGDGYTASERQEFFDDIQRLTTDMFQGVTFRSYLPVFNIWAIYVESVESGIGYDGGPKNTPFGLYREAGQLRAIYPGDPSYARQICALTGPSGCEYPSLIGNDDFYGGLGGEFVISTRSNRTGTVVLRHEMGHNFVDVGEEYDGGYVYRGVNAAHSLATLGWRSWLSGDGNPVEERTMYRILEYPWHDLSQGVQTFTFNSDGAYNRWYIIVSVSAAGEADSLEFTLDGEILPWESRGFDDREFYDWRGVQGLSPGQHTFSVRSKTPSTHPDIPRMICSVNLHEFGTEDEFHADKEYVSAYPTWDINKRKSFRPTNAGCLMRNMTHNEFCSICREGMWYEFLERISLIDSVNVSDTTNPDGTKTVTLSTLKLAHLREPGNEVDGEALEVRWFLGGVEQTQHKDLFEIDAVTGNWRVEVDFITPEVRDDPQGLLKEEEMFTI